MKKIFLVALGIFCIGCVTVEIPRYIKEESPYRKTYYASFEEVLLAVTNALEETGWRVSELTNPSIYEEDKQIDESKGKQGLVFTEMRQTPLFLASRYLNLNVFLRSDGQTTDVEIRYMATTPTLFKTMTNHKNDAVVNKIFKHIDEHLNP